LYFDTLIFTSHFIKLHIKRNYIHTPTVKNENLQHRYRI
jgi:hypothetical protein